MARYRKIDPRIWCDAKFRSMSPAGQYVFLYLLTHPALTMIGAMRATVEGLAAELGWPLILPQSKGLPKGLPKGLGEGFPKGFAEAFGEGIERGMVWHSPEAAFLALPAFIKYNPPDNPNVVRGWRAIVDLLPECELRNQYFQRIRAHIETLPKGFAEGLPKGFGEGFQEPLPQPYAKPGAGTGAGTGYMSQSIYESPNVGGVIEGVKGESSRAVAQLPIVQPKIPLKMARPIIEDVEAYCTEAGISVDASAFVYHYEANGWKVGGKSPMKDWKAAVRNWARRDAERQGSDLAHGGRPRYSRMADAAYEADVMLGLIKPGKGGGK